MLIHSTPHEVWKPVVGHENWYEVSNLGRVRRSLAGKGTRVGKILKPWIDTRGYYGVALSRDGIVTKVPIHHLVAAAFHLNKHGKSHINHRDGIKLNNASENLEWATKSEDTQHAYDTGLSRSGSRHHWCKYSDEQIAEVRALSSSMALEVIAQRTGMSVAYVSLIIQGKYRQATASAT
jgi:hypothetical protein